METAQRATALWIGNLPLSVQAIATLCEVSDNTVRNWFEQGLERVTQQGRAYSTAEKLTRFLRSDAKYANCTTPARILDLLQPRIAV